MASGQLLPPSAFSAPEEPTPAVLLSPQKFTTFRGISRKTVKLQTDPLAASFEGDATPPSTPEKRLTRTSKHNVENISPCFTVTQKGTHEEIERLRKENFRLMEENLRKTYEYCAKGKEDNGLTRALQPFQQNSTRHIDSLISKQVEEINALKHKLTDLELDHSRAISELEGTATACGHSHQHDLQRLRGEHLCALQRLESQHADHQKALQKKHLDVEDQCQLQKGAITALQNKLEQQEMDRNENSDTIAQLNAENIDIQKEGEVKDKTIQRLQIQLSSYQQRDGEKERWPQEKNRLETRITTITSESEAVKDENSALNLRLSAINDILSAQQDSLRTSSADETDQDKLHRLLSRWRNKVYQLLVQQKSQELVTVSETKKWEELTRSVKGQLKSLQSKVKELEGVAKEKEAQITVLMKRKQSLELSVSGLQSSLAECEAHQSQQEKSIQQLTSVVSEYSTKFQAHHEVLVAADSRLKREESRIISAVKQVHLCQVTVSSSLAQSAEVNGRLSREAEGVNVRLSEKVAECDSLTLRLSDSESVKLGCQQKCAELQQSLLTQVQSLKERDETIRGLKEEMDGLSRHRELERKKIELEVERRYKEKTAEYDHKIFELKKELAKTIVSLRQLERRHETEQSYHARQLEEVTSQNGDKVSRLEAELTTAQVEKNILHSNLTSNAAIRERVKPRLTWSDFGSTHATPVKADTRTHSLPVTPSDKQLLLGSVKQLAARILNSESDSEDDLGEGREGYAPH